VLLAAVVATGVLGRDGSTSTAATAERGAASPRPGPTGAAGTGAGAAIPGDRSRVASVLPPPRALGLPVRSVADVIASQAASTDPGALLAVRGFLTVLPDREDCLPDDLAARSAVLTGSGAPRDPERPAMLCRRGAVLSLDPAPVIARDGDDWRWVGRRGTPHLHPVIFPGISLGVLEEPSRLADIAPDEGVPPASVVVIGRFDDPRVVDRRTNARHPDAVFSIERLAWADGRWQDRRLARLTSWAADDLDADTASALVIDALPGSTVILSQMTTRATILAAIDPLASAHVGDAASDEDRVWYLRAMVRPDPPVDTLADAGGPRRLGWAVVANDGTILASAVDD
jgi:hypothetical protein